MNFMSSKKVSKARFQSLFMQGEIGGYMIKQRIDMDTDWPKNGF